PPNPGTILSFQVNPDDPIPGGTMLAKMYDTNLYQKMKTLQAEIQGARGAAEAAESKATKGGLSQIEKLDAETQGKLKRVEQESKQQELDELLARTHGLRNSLGEFAVVAPLMSPSERGQVGSADWTILTNNYRDLERKEVRPNESIMRVGVKN